MKKPSIYVAIHPRNLIIDFRLKNPTVSKNIICIFLNKLFPIFSQNKSYNKNPRFI